MVLSSNVVAIGIQQKDCDFVLKESYRSTVKVCRQRLIRQLSQLMINMFEKLDDTLYKLANKAESDMFQSNYFDAMREVRKEREKIERAFYKKVLADFDKFWDSGPATYSHSDLPQVHESDSFSLVEKEDLEEELAINNMILKGDNRFYRELYALDRRFSHMANDLDVNGRNNPVSPAFLCNSLRDAVNCLESSISIKLVIFKQFESELIENLGILYDELNDYLTSADILPELNRKIARSKVHPADTRQSQMPLSDGTEIEPDLAETGLAAESFASLQYLLERNRDNLSPSQAIRRASLPIVDTQEVLGALTSLQKVLQLEQLNTAGGWNLKSNLFKKLHIADDDSAQRQIDRVDQDAIDLVSMLFEFILDDNNLPDAMKALLGRLQIPLLKIAIQDKGFFSKKRHPARRLLDSLAQAAIGWSEQQGREEDGLYRRIESIVHRINTEYESDISVFEELNEEFDKFQEQKNRGSLIVEKRTTQVTQGKERLAEARAVVFEEINVRLQARDDLPDVVMELIWDGWKDVLLLTGLREGVGSDEWQNALLLMDKLIWSIMPKVEADDRQKLLKDIPDLLKGLREGLNSISFDQHRTTYIFREIQNCHVSALRGESDHMTQPPTDTRSEIEVADIPQDMAQEDKAKDNILLDTQQHGKTDEEIVDAFLDQANTLSIGTWLEVKETGDDVAKRVKLAWKSDVTGTQLFVNRKGMKVAELKLHELAAWLRTGNATILEQTDVPLMERALNAMISTLKSSDETRRIDE